MLASLLLLLLAASPALAESPTPAASAEAQPSAAELLGAIDKNLQFQTRTTTITMTVENPRRTRIYSMRTYGRGESEAAIEYLEPARDKGTRMLRLGQDMWMYLPAIERVQKISGHMLRQGMMGSDLSYEDMTSASSWRTAYDATVTGSEPIEGRPCWKIEMKAKDDTIAYPKRIAWVDAETKIPVKQELYALSGMLVKTWEMGAIKQFEGGRQFPTRMVISDKVQEGTRTVLEMSDLSFGVALEEEVFSQRWLERK